MDDVNLKQLIIETYNSENKLGSYAFKNAGGDIVCTVVIGLEHMAFKLLKHCKPLAKVDIFDDVNSQWLNFAGIEPELEEIEDDEFFGENNQEKLEPESYSLTDME